MELSACVLIEGVAQGPVLRSDRPLSFWGGVDPVTGCVTDTGSDIHGRSLAGTILVLPATRGSSSSSSIMLELIHANRAPAAIILGQADAIIGIGILAAAEIGLPQIPLLEMALADQAGLLTGMRVSIVRDGTVTAAGAAA